MVHSNTSGHSPIDRNRLRDLKNAAYNVRQRAIDTGGDLEGWRLARLMRDARSLPQARAAEHIFSIWMRSHSPAIDRVA